MGRDVWGTYVTPDEYEAAAKLGISKDTIKICGNMPQNPSESMMWKIKWDK